MGTNNVINANSVGIAGYDGNGTWTGSAATQYNVQVGGATTHQLASVAPSATSGVPLISQGSSSNPAFGTAVVAGGGTGSASFNTTGVVISGATSTTALTALTLTDGQVVIGSSAGAVAAATLSAGTGISISNGHNTITINNTGAGLTWTDATNASYTVAAQNGYVADRSSLVTFTLPANNSIGDIIQIVGKGSGGWSIVYTTNQKIIFGSSATTTTTGNLASTNANDCCTLVCTTASASAPIFTVVNAVGNLTVV